MINIQGLKAKISEKGVVKGTANNKIVYEKLENIEELIDDINNEVVEGSAVDKLNYLSDTKILIKNGINKINNILTDESTFRSYPQELFNGYLDILNNGTDTLWDNLEKASQTGAEIVLENVETAPMKIELSGNTSQDGTPTPEHPQQVKVVKGENVVSVSGENKSYKVDYPINLTTKNLFDKDNANILNAWINAGTKAITASGSNRTIWVEAEGNTTYKVKKIADTSSNGRFRVGTSANVPVVGGTLAQAIQNDNAEEISITTGANDKYIAVFCYNTNSSITLEKILASLEIEEANISYAEMCKIDDNKDYLFKRNGKWFIHKAIGKVTDQKGSTGITIVDMVADTKVYSYYGGTVNGTTITYNSAISDTNYIYYLLAAPTEEEITNNTLIEQLEAISKAKSVKSKTYITQTNDGLPFIINASAIKKL